MLLTVRFRVQILCLIVKDRKDVGRGRRIKREKEVKINYQQITSPQSKL